jgi:hypothetical protein
MASGLFGDLYRDAPGLAEISLELAKLLMDVRPLAI